MKPKTPYYLFLIVMLLGLSVYSFGAVVTPEGAEPDPWWLHVEKIQDLLMKWIGAATVVLTAVIGLIFTIWTLFKAKLKELETKTAVEITAVKERQDRASETDKHLQDQVTAVAIQTPTQPNL